jgi:hypothetical protein
VLWEQAVDAILGGELGKAMAARGAFSKDPPVKAPEPVAQAFASVLGNLCRGLPGVKDDLEVSTNEADVFDKKLLGALGARSLWSRPLFGLTSNSASVRWGALSRKELAALKFPNILMGFDDWVPPLQRGVASARRVKRDLLAFIE